MGDGRKGSTVDAAVSLRNIGGGGRRPPAMFENGGSLGVGAAGAAASLFWVCGGVELGAIGIFLLTNKQTLTHGEEMFVGQTRAR